MTAAGVHRAAPGVDVWSTYRGGWDSGSGTSDAAAVVSGAAGLLRSAVPTLTAAQTVAVLTATAQRYPGLEGRVRSGGALDLIAAVRCARAAGMPCLGP